MRYAEVAVDAPAGYSRTFSYSIPPRFALEAGQLIWVPFGRRIVQGIVTELTSAPQVDVTKDVLQPVEPSPLVGATGLQLARWMSAYYLSSLFDALAVMLPPGFRDHVRSRITPAPSTEYHAEGLDPKVQEGLDELLSKSPMSESEFTKLLGRNGARVLNRLVEQGLVRRQVELPRPRSNRYRCYLNPITPTSSYGQLPPTTRRLSPRQEALLEAVQAKGSGYAKSLANKEFGPAVGHALVEKGLLSEEWVREEPEQVLPSPINPMPSTLTLTSAQSDVLTHITASCSNPLHQPRSFLLHGVTGSGKTEVYLRAVEAIVERGQQAIFLVPEISLTPQTVERVNARFPGRVAVLHSQMTDRQKFDRWWKIRDGEYDVVVGPRSALFAPVPNLGLIIIDEEHEWTYKQEESQPLYHARTVALELAGLSNAVVVLGSATPGVETYYQARLGRHRLLELPDRIGTGSPTQASPLARVDICDMGQELRDGNRSIFSRRLTESLKQCITQGNQAILFLNRRGSSPIVQCRDCGYVVTCPRCSVSLTYHSTDGRMVCHRCNRRTRPPARCRECGGTRIRQLGIGTQRVVEEAAALLPGVRIDRWDADTTRAGTSASETMQRLQSGATQVLVGTQMVAKGLDVPNVTLVGVVLADIGMHLPDFRTGERAFSLLCQVAGRAGRGFDPGLVIIQTYNPDQYAITAAANQDYAAFYRQEIRFRRDHGNPPFNSLVHLVYHDTSDTACQRQASSMARMFRQRAYGRGLTDVEVIGPAPGIPERVRGHYRWHLLLRGRNLHRFMEGVRFPSNCTVDVDPAHVL